LWSGSFFIGNGADSTQRAARRRELASHFCFFQPRFPQAHDWRDALIIVKPDTVIKWHREGFRLYWRWKSKTPIGRPPIDKEIRELIRRISRENTLWGVPRIQSELRLLGFNVTEKPWRNTG
jgi:hypothetical protein